MIRKIARQEWLKRFSSMTNAEKQNYCSKVQQWLDKESQYLFPYASNADAQYQNVLMVSVAWNDATCEAWNKACILCTAMYGKGAENWLPEGIYKKSATRAIRWIKETLQSVNMPTPSPSVVEPTANSQRPTANSQQAPVRPKHIDQYVHLLPEKTQQHAEEVKPLLRELETVREDMRRMMEDKKSSPSAREKLAKQATKIDTRVRNIYKELDREWEILVASGRVTVDELGQAHIVETPTSTGSATKTVETPAKPALTKEQKEKVKALRGFLKDTRRGNGRTRAEHVRKWKATYDELIKLAGPDAVTDKVKEAAQHYGIALRN